MSTMTAPDAAPTDELLRYPDAARQLGITVPELSERITATGTQVFVIPGPYRAIHRDALPDLAAVTS